uniref:Uncharacterized protein n=1 Tax=Oryctolagus cuniculus TaxID=9986 RepID=G1TSM1_RABIT
MAHGEEDSVSANNAKKQAVRKKRGHDQKAAATATLIYTCNKPAAAFLTNC